MNKVGVLMKIDNKTLTKYLAEVKRIEESRSKNADKKIRSLYKTLLKNLNGFIGEYYTKYADNDGILNGAILQQKAKYASFLEEVDKNIKEITPAISKTIKSTVESSYKACYEGMINGFSKSFDSFKDSFKGLSIKPEVIKAAVENPISGLTLPERLQKHRQDIIYDIKSSITNALMTGERYDTTTKKLAERLDVSYGKANRIVRTESHRVQEKGLLDGAEKIGEKVKDDGLVYAVIWRNMGDIKVRPNIRVHTSKGWKTYKSKTKANHIKMEGQVVEAGGYFDLGNGVKAKSPGESGTPENDCNCRCTLEYELMTVEEFAKATGKTVNEVRKKYNIFDKNIEKDNKNQFTNPDESDIIKLEHNYQYIQEADLPLWRKSVAKCSEEDYKQIYSHGTGGYIRTPNSFKMNAALRNKAEDTLSDDDKLTISTLKRVISENATDRDIILDRYVDANYIKSNFGFDPEESGSIKKLVNRLFKEFRGALLVDNGFISTSFSENNVFTWRPIKLKIQAPKGTNMFATRNHAESEVILNTGTKMKLISATKNGNNQIELVLEIQNEV